MKARLGVVMCAALVSLLMAAPASAAFGLLPGSEGFSATAEAEGGAPATQAGSHPAALSMKVAFNKAGQFTDGDLRDLSLELPPG